MCSIKWQKNNEQKRNLWAELYNLFGNWKTKNVSSYAVRPEQPPERTMPIWNPFSFFERTKLNHAPGARGGGEGDKKPFIPQSQRIISHQGPNFVRTSSLGPGSRFQHSLQNHLIDTGALLTSSSSCWCYWACCCCCCKNPITACCCCRRCSSPMATSRCNRSEISVRSCGCCWASCCCCCCCGCENLIEIS